jgi:hypothetical protein
VPSALGNRPVTSIGIRSTISPIPSWLCSQRERPSLKFDAADYKEATNIGGRIVLVFGRIVKAHCYYTGIDSDQSS